MKHVRHHLIEEYYISSTTQERIEKPLTMEKAIIEIVDHTERVCDAIKNGYIIYEEYDIELCSPYIYSYQHYKTRKSGLVFGSLEEVKNKIDNL